MIAVDKFEVSKKYDYLEEKYIYDDLDAVLNFAKEIKTLFKLNGISESGRYLYSIEYDLPSELKFDENTNVFKKMTDNYMTDFKEKADALVTDLEAVKKEADEVEQCKKLNKIFGDDFPIPEVDNAAKQQICYIPPTSSSGVR